MESYPCESWDRLLKMEPSPNRLSFSLPDNIKPHDVSLELSEAGTMCKQRTAAASKQGLVGTCLIND